MLQRYDDTDAALIDRLHRVAFDYFLTLTNPENGLVADTSRPGSPCSIAATGFALSTYPVAVERGWIGRDMAAQRVLAALRFFSDSEQSRERHATGHRGFYYHFLDMKTGQRVWNCELSLIDSALLFAGMLTSAAYFTGDAPDEQEIRSLTTSLYERADWHWALNKGETLVMGWKPGGGFLRHRWEGYSEALILYVLALASPTHPIPAKSYEAFAAKFDWMTFDGKPYLYAGPLFIHLFSHAWIDFREIRDHCVAARDTDYFRNTEIAIAVHRDYAARNPGHFKGYSADIWGLTACDGPGGRRRLHDGRRQNFMGYRARGAPFGPDDGTMAPWAPLACLPFDRAAALGGTRAILETYPGLLTDDRFPGSFNPSFKSADPEGWVDDRCVGLDHGLLVMSIENDRSGLVWSLMRQSPIIRLGLERAGFSGGWLGTPGAQTA